MPIRHCNSWPAVRDRLFGPEIEGGAAVAAPGAGELHGPAARSTLPTLSVVAAWRCCWPRAAPLRSQRSAATVKVLQANGFEVAFRTKVAVER